MALVADFFVGERGGFFAEFIFLANLDAVFAAGEGGLFAVEFLPGFEAAEVEGVGFEGGFDGAAGFGGVLAVAEAAGGGEGFEVGEGGEEGIGGFAEGKAAEAGGVDDKAADGGFDEVAVGGAVAAFVVEVADFHHVLQVLIGEMVDEGGFADAGGAEDDGGDAGGEQRAELVDALAGDDGDGEDGEVVVAVEGLDLIEERSGIGAKIGFGEQDDGADGVIAGEGDVAFEAAEGEVFVEAGGEEGEVDVDGEELVVAGDAVVAVAFEAAGEGGFAGEDAGDLDRAVGFLGGGIKAAVGGSSAEDDPVADGGEVGTDGGLVAHFAGDFGPEVSGGSVDEVGLFVFLDDAGKEGGGFAGE